MKRLAFIFLFIITSAIAVSSVATAQCAMCTINAEQGVKNGNTQSKGINTGVMYLMSVPYVLISGIGALWYFKYRKRSSGPSIGV